MNPPSMARQLSKGSSCIWKRTVKQLTSGRGASLEGSRSRGDLHAGGDSHHPSEAEGHPVSIAAELSKRGARGGWQALRKKHAWSATRDVELPAASTTQASPPFVAPPSQQEVTIARPDFEGSVPGEPADGGTLTAAPSAQEARAAEGVESASVAISIPNALCSSSER